MACLLKMNSNMVITILALLFNGTAGDDASAIQEKGKRN